MILRRGHQQQQQQQQAAADRHRHRLLPAAAHEAGVAAAAPAPAPIRRHAAALAAVADEQQVPDVASSTTAAVVVPGVSSSAEYHQQQNTSLASPPPPPLSLPPPITSMEDLLGRIRKGSLPNGGTLRLGWKDSDFLTSSRTVTAIKRALKQQPTFTSTTGSSSSSIKNLSIGWRHNLHQQYGPKPQPHGAPPLNVSSSSTSSSGGNRSRTSTMNSTDSSNNMIITQRTAAASSSSSSSPTSEAIPRLSDNPRRVVLAQFLLTLGRTCPHQLESVQLVLNDWLPMAVLQDFLQHQTSLRTIDFQAVTMLQSPKSSSYSSSTLLSNLLKRGHRRGPGRPFFTTTRKRTAPIPTTTNSNDQKKDTTAVATASTAAALPRITSVVSILLQQQHLDRHPYLKTIKLIDCDLHNDDAIQLADFIHLRGGIAELVLKCNRQLGISGGTTTGIKVLCQAPVMQLLDLSCCDLSPRHGAAMAQALAQRPWVLPKLLLAGNYRLFEDHHHHHHNDNDDSSNSVNNNNNNNNNNSNSSMALFQAASCEKIRHVDVSHCELTSDVTIQILHALRRLTHYQQHDNRRVTIRLEQVIMHACRIGNDHAVDALCVLLSQQQSSQVNHCQYLQQHKSKSTTASTSASSLSNGSTPLSLRVLHLHNPRSRSQDQQQVHQAMTSSVSVAQLQQIAEQVVHNYHLEELKIDHHGGPIAITTVVTTNHAAAADATSSNVTNHPHHYGDRAGQPLHDNRIPHHCVVSVAATIQTTVLSAHDIWKTMDFYFKLNRAGRRILLSPQPQPLPQPRRQQRKRRTTSATSVSTDMTTCKGLLTTRGNNINRTHHDDIDNSNSNADWYSALAMAGNDDKKNDDGDDSYSHNTLELLYWMVRHSADRFGHLRAQHYQ